MAVSELPMPSKEFFLCFGDVLICFARYRHFDQLVVRQHGLILQSDPDDRLPISEHIRDIVCWRIGKSGWNHYVKSTPSSGGPHINRHDWHPVL
jgi:hypothetical protein